MPNALDAALESGTEFGETPVENLLSVASVLLSDLEQAGFSAAEIRRIVKLVHRFTETSVGGRN